MDSSGSQLFDALFVQRWPWYAGGAAIGVFVVVLLLVGRRTLGVSTGFQDACAAPFDPSVRSSWRLPFIAGIIGGGMLAGFLAGGPQPTTSMGMFDTLFALPFAAKTAIFGGGGILIGFGTRLACGCTSGHGIVGMAQFAPCSLIATGSFMFSGFLTTHAAWALLGG